MNTRKIIVYGLIAVLLTLAFIALSMTGCEQPTDITPTVTLTGITAEYTPTTAVFPGTPLDDLKADLTVTAYYSNGDEKELDAEDYGLSGTLTVGTSDITVTYQGKTTDFTVTVTAEPNNDITYTAAQTGGTDIIATTTGIVFTFSESVDSLELTAADIAIGGAAEKGAAAFTKSGSNWLLSPITVNDAGNATVSINKTGIETETKHVMVYKAGQAAPTLTGITAAYTQGTTIIYPTTPLDELKAGLTVKAQYTVGGEITLSAGEYTLDGTLTVGTSTVTVSYEGRTAPFTVNVTAAPEYWNITWHLDGGTAGTGAYPAHIVKGEILARPSPDPTKASNTFGGWYSDSGLTQPYTFANPVTANLSLYAKWVVIRTAPTITTTSLPNGFKRIAYSHTLTATGDTEITWSIEGALPDGLDISGNTIAGTPTTVGVSSFTVTATNDVGSHSRQLSITITSSGANMSEAIELTDNIWADGNIATPGGQQWFVFTATASTQYIHAAFGTLDNRYGMHMQVYNSSGATVGSQTFLTSSTPNRSQSLTQGQTYYIKVWPRYDDNDSGTYRIAFNTSFVPPGVIPLTENQWADGSLPSSGDQQWFVFTATASTQYIHIEPGTLRNLYVNVYDSSGTVQGNEANMFSTITSRSLTPGQTYYIRVRPLDVAYAGAYRIGFNASTTAPPVQLPPNAIPLFANQWADGNLPTYDEQWFTFTATASEQYIHIEFGTLTYLYVNFYDSSGATVESETALYVGSTPNISRSLTVGQTYYIRVRPYGSGTYRIGFNASIVPPGNLIPLTENQWADGSLPSGGQQWFTFTATVSTQYIHFEPGTLTGLYAQVYDGSEAAVESEAGLSSTNRSASRSLTVGQTYYIRVRNSSNSGTYRIMFNASFVPPGNLIPLTENQWADGNLPTSSDQQWFTFTATASTQYIHIEFGTLTWLYVQVYDSSSAAVGSETRLYSSTTNTSRSLTSGQTYYIRVRPYYDTDSGTYRIVFNASTAAPIDLPSNAIPLTENQWADGSLPTSSDEQWFTFTATASTQYIHFEFGTLTYLSVQLYDSGGATVGGQSYLYSSNTYTSRTLTPGQTYYIRVRPDGSISGTYRITFNTLFVPPGAIPLTESQWADGSLPSDGQQWFTFAATAVTQWIHIETGTLTQLYVQVYDSSGAAVGSETMMYSSTPNTSRSLTPGQTYYIRVRPYNSSYSGTYRITFNTSFFAPGFNPIPLTESQWADGSLPTYDVQWFTFTATASTHYIHAAFGTLTNLYVQVYDSSGATVGSETNLYGPTPNTSRSLIPGQTYYIRVRPYGSGTGDYRIGFNASIIPPGVNPIPLTANQWAQGNLPTSSDQQWFTFTATASTQYIHFSTTGTLKDVNVNVYNSSDSVVGSETRMYSTTTRTSRTLTVGQIYYIRVRPYSSSISGDYRIAFNTSTTAPQ